MFYVAPLMIWLCRLIQLVAVRGTHLANHILARESARVRHWPMVRKPGQRLVAIDPGRRDINYVKTDEAHETPSPCTSSTSKFFRSSQFFGISTRRHVKEAKRRRIATVTIELQKRILVSAEVFWGGWTYTRFRAQRQERRGQHYEHLRSARR